MYKQVQISQGVYERIAVLWKKAKTALSSCKRLVVIGYSFPLTDFDTKKLFLEVFSDNSLDQLIVVNPDTSVVQTVKDLSHFDKPVIVCKDLYEFMDNSES